MRTFIALPIPFDIKQQINDALLSLKEKYRSSLRWVNIENYHLTLNFLGDISQEQYEILDTQLQKVILPQKFDLQIQEFGAFPSLRNARVFWLGFTPNPKLLELYNVIQQPIANSGIKIEEKTKFKPHLTLARAKTGSVVTQDKLPIISVTAFLVNEIILYRSELTPKGPIYTVLKKYHLK